LSPELTSKSLVCARARGRAACARSRRTADLPSAALTVSRDQAPSTLATSGQYSFVVEATATRSSRSARATPTPRQDRSASVGHVNCRVGEAPRAIACRERPHLGVPRCRRPLGSLGGLSTRGFFSRRPSV